MNNNNPEQVSNNDEQKFAEEELAAMAAESSIKPSPSQREIERLNQELEAAKAQAQQNWDKALRAIAELDNVNRRAQRDVEHAHKYGNEKLLNALIPVIDSIDHALEVTGSANVPSVHEGLEMTLKMFIDTLNKFGVVRIDPNNEAFNPALHEAMTMQPAEGVASNTVITVFQKGYQLNGRLIRPARVVVAK